MGIDLNTLKTSHDSLISIAVIEKKRIIAEIKVFERVSHVICSYFICKYVSQSQQWPVTLNPTADTPPSNKAYKLEAKIWLEKMPFISKLCYSCIWLSVEISDVLFGL